MFAEYEVFNESLMTDTDALCLYIQDDLKGKIPDTYKDVQGRISISNETSDEIKPIIQKKSGGLSTGGIIAIMIPSIAILIALTVLTFVFTSKTSSAIAPSALKQGSTMDLNH